MNILINARDFNHQGGVVSLYQTLRPHFQHGVEFFRMGARIHESSVLRRGQRLVADYRRFAGVLRRDRPDVVILNPSLAPASVIRDGIFLRLAARRACKTIVFFHGWEHRFENQLKRRWQRVFRASYAAADAFVVLAHEFRERLREFGFQQAIHRGSTAVEDALLRQRDRRRARGAISGASFRLVFLARLVREKGIYETLEAFGIVRSRFPWATLTVVGDGPEFDTARQWVQTRRIEGVTFRGQLHGGDKFAVLANSDCYVLPTYGEGLPLTVLEAMALRLPVITCSVGGLADFFQSGRMGYLVPQQQPVAIAEGISRLVQRPEIGRQMGEFNHRYARKHFAASFVARQLEGFAEQLFDHTRSGGRHGAAAVA